MIFERHLMLQELTLRPSEEWKPQISNWLVARVTEGVGYWLQDGTARELKVGDGFIVGGNVPVLLRASQLGLLKLQCFTVQPRYLNGLLSASEWHRMKVTSASPLRRVAIFAANEPVAQKFSRISDLLPDHGLSLRCAMLQIWSGALHNLMAAPIATFTGKMKLYKRFQQLVGNMTEAELADASLADLAAEVNCSEKHFSRLYSEEFGVTFHERKIELRLQWAQQLLTESDIKIVNVAYNCGYRHLSLFNSMFKKRFGVTPSQWRQQNGIDSPSKQTWNHLSRTTPVISVLIMMLVVF
jgi:AraC-like DNA-binding protein